MWLGILGILIYIQRFHVKTAHTHNDLEFSPHSNSMYLLVCIVLVRFFFVLSGFRHHRAVICLRVVMGANVWTE